MSSQEQPCHLWLSFLMLLIRLKNLAWKFCSPHCQENKNTNSWNTQAGATLPFLRLYCADQVIYCLTRNEITRTWNQKIHSFIQCIQCACGVRAKVSILLIPAVMTSVRYIRIEEQKMSRRMFCTKPCGNSVWPVLAVYRESKTVRQANPWADKWPVHFMACAWCPSR